LGVGLDQQVHRPVRLVLIHARQPRDHDVLLADPFGCGELGGRVDRPVGDQREQHPLDVGGEPADPEHLPQGAVDPELAPQSVQQMHGAHRPRPGHAQPVTGQLPDVRAGGAGGIAVGLTQVAVNRGDQPAQPVGVEPVLAAQVGQHLRLRRPRHPPVVRQLHVAHHRPVSIAALRRPQVHAHTQPASTSAGQRRHGKSCAHA